MPDRNLNAPQPSTPQRAYREERQRWQLVAACLEHCELTLTSLRSGENLATLLVCMCLEAAVLAKVCVQPADQSGLLSVVAICSIGCIVCAPPTAVAALAGDAASSTAVKPPGLEVLLDLLGELYTHFWQL